MNELETEILAARRAFPEAQRLLAGPTDQRPGIRVPIGWHDVSIDPRSGAFAVASFGGPFADLVGETLRVTAGGREVFVYLVGRAPVEDALSLSRRAWLALAPLTADLLTATVEIIE